MLEAEKNTENNQIESPAQNDRYKKGWSYRDENFQLTARMQFELARRFYGLPETTDRAELDDVVLRWVDQDNALNSKNFRDFVEANPEVVALFKTNPDAALEQIEEHIYEKKNS